MTITAKNNGVDAPDRRVTVTGAVTGGNGGAALTITDDEETPTVTLALAPTSITENGGVSTVTASLNGLSSADVVVTVSASAVDPAVANDFTLSGNRELTIKAGQMESTGTVAVNRRQQRRRRAEQDRRGDGVGDGRQRRDGAGGADADDRPSSERVTGDGLGDAGLSRRDGRLPADRDDADDRAGGDGESTGTVTITAVNNTVDAPDKSVDVTATMAGGNGVATPAKQPLTIWMLVDGRRTSRAASATALAIPAHS